MRKILPLLLLCAARLFSQVPLSQVYPAPIVPAPFQILAPGPYSLCYDLDISPYAGGEDLLFATRSLENCTTFIAKKTPVAYSKSMFARTLRLAELTLLWLPLNYFAMVVQHEVFGHGYRIRDINHGRVKTRGYEFDWPPPYGSGDAATEFSFSERLTLKDLTCISMAGIESANILAQITKIKWLGAGRVDPRQSILYLVSNYNLNLYASSLDGEDVDGHDLWEYARAINELYPKGKFTESRLRALAWINLIDPFTYYSLFSWFHYLSSGKETKIPMIPICGYGYLFGARLGLTPFGPEYFWDNYLLKGNAPVYFYLKAGWHAGNTYEGLGMFVPRLWTGSHWILGVRSDAWRQRKHWGAAASLITAYQVNDRYGFQAELGYKTRGFLPGYSLYASPVVRLSYLLQM